MAGPAVVDRSGPGPAVHEPLHHRRADQRLVPQGDNHPVGLPGPKTSRPQRNDAACPDSQSWHTTGSARPNETRSSTSSARAPEHDHHAVDHCDAGLRSYRVPQQRPSIQRRQQLRPPARTRRRPRRRRPGPSPATRPARTGSRRWRSSWNLVDAARAARPAARRAAVPRRHHLGQDRQSRLLTVHRAEIQPYRAPTAARARSPRSPRACSRSRRAACARREPIAPTNRRRRAQRDLQRRVVQLRIVGEHDDRCRRIDPAEPLERLRRPRGHHLDRIGEPLRVANRARGSTT